MFSASDIFEHLRVLGSACENYNMSEIAWSTLSCRQATEICEAARALFEDPAKEYTGSKFACARLQLWINLGVALYGEDDPRVIALKPKPRFRVGDWVVAIGGKHEEYGALLISHIGEYDAIEATIPNKKPGRYLGVSHPSHIRFATPEEIAKARGEP